MTGTLKRVSRGAVVYGLQPILGRVASVLMLPVYTRVLSPSDYGVLQLLETTVDVVGLLFTAGAINGVSRFFFKRSDRSYRDSLLSTAFLVQLGLAAAAGACIALLAAPISSTILRGDGSVLQVRLAAANLVTGVLLVVPLLRLQLLERATLYSTVTLVRLVIQLGLNIVLVAFFRVGVTGVLFSTLISNLLIGGAAAVMMLREIGCKIDPEIRADLARLGRPARLTAIGSYAMNFGDRYFLSLSWGTAVVGTYGLAYQFGFGFSQFFTAPVVKAWDPVRYELATRSPEERNPEFQRVFELTNLLLVSAFAALAVGARPIILLLTTPSFYSAEALIAPIVGAYVVQAWTGSFNFQINVSEQAYLATRATWAAAAATVVLYATLIPSYGAAGAAWATLLGFVLRALLTYRYAQRVWPIPYRWNRTLRVVALSIAAVMAVRGIGAVSLTEAIVASAIVYASYTFLALAAGVAPEDRHRLFALAAKIGGARSLRSRV